MPSWRSVWVTRETITVRHVRGALDALEKGGMVPYGEVRIVMLREGDGFTAPNGNVIREADLPAQGILIIADE